MTQAKRFGVLNISEQDIYYLMKNGCILRGGKRVIGDIMKLRVILPTCTEIIGHVKIRDIKSSNKIRRCRVGKHIYLERYDPKYEVI